LFAQLVQFIPFVNQKVFRMPSQCLCGKVCVHLVLLVALPVLTQAQTEVTIEASKDNTLYEVATGDSSNGAGEYLFVGRTNQAAGSIRRGLIAFNLSGIPSGSTITNVTLTLNMSKITPSGAQTIGLYRATADWGEGTSNAGLEEGRGAAATANDATWLHRFFSTVLWSTAGGTYASTPSASQTIGAVGSYTWGSTSGMVSDVQQWLNTPPNNFGWVIVGNEATALTAKRFDTRQNAAAATRPKLIVTYTPPTSVEENDPQEFTLHQNYPNPFNPSTNIRFSLAATSKTTLKIFNILGQEVAMLIDGVLESGAHSIEWNAKDFPSGIYVYRLASGGAIATRKLILSK
jgi:hypothetical protein